jgi:hypothetical protein
MAHGARKTEHSGAKNGGGHWGKRAEAKAGSTRRRREDGKLLIRQDSPGDSREPRGMAGGDRGAR